MKVKAQKEITNTDLRSITKTTKQQRQFIELWLNPKSSTFGNAYQSALQSGYSESTARVITGNAKGLQWVQDAKALFASLEPEHIYLKLQELALESPYDRDKLKALEMMAKIRGMFIDRTEHKVNVNFTNSVPRPKIEANPIIEVKAEEEEA